MPVSVEGVRSSRRKRGKANLRKKKMILVCEDEIYAERFQAYLNRHYRELPYEWHIFTGIEDFETNLPEQGAGLLMISESLARDVLRRHGEAAFSEKFDCRILLTDRFTGNAPKGWHSLSRYQPVNVLVKRLLGLYAVSAKKEEGESVEKDAMYTVGIYSPCGRAGKTELSLTLARELSGERAALLLNFEWCSGFGSRFRRQYERNLSDLLSDILEKRKNPGERLLSLIEKNGAVDYIPPLRSREDIWDTDPETWRELFRIIREETGYEALVCDFGQGVRGLNELLNLCDRIFMPVPSDPVSEAKAEEFLSGLQRHHQTLADRIERVASEDIFGGSGSFLGFARRPGDMYS